MTIEAMKQALEALESADWYIDQLEMIVYSEDDTGTHDERAKVQTAITALRQAIEQAQKPDGYQEPVATVQCINGLIIGYLDVMQPVGTKLYTFPPQRQWVGLTDEEKQQFVVAYYPSSWDRKTAVVLMNNYEAYLKEKNNG